jgi:pentatricopeptide repeat protein
MLVHSQIIECSFEAEVLIGGALIDMYSKCGNHEEACKVLYGLPGRDVISWGAVISGYAQDGQGFPALSLFARMQKEGINPDQISILSALKSCANVGAIIEGRLIHKELIKNGLVNDVVIGNTIVDMYAKCGCLEDSQRALQSLENHDVVTWNAFLAGCAQQGRCFLANVCFTSMQQHGLEPDDKTYTSILAGCSHAGLLEQGHGYFSAMIRKLGIVPGIETYTCMIDLLGRSGCLREAIDLVHTIPILPDIVVWKSLFTSCRTYNNKALGKWILDQILDLSLNDGFGFVLMSNMCTDDNYAEIWEVVDQFTVKENMESVLCCVN